MSSKTATRQCSWCQKARGDEYLSLTPTLVTGTTRLTYKALSFCSPDCLREWSNDLTWGPYPPDGGEQPAATKGTDDVSDL
jgi:hypothetical protein